MKIFAKNRMLSSEKIESSGAPRNKYCPRGDNRAQREKQVKIKAVDKKAVEMIAGLIRMTVSNKGPSPRPIYKKPLKCCLRIKFNQS